MPEMILSWTPDWRSPKQGLFSSPKQDQDTTQAGGNGTDHVM